MYYVAQLDGSNICKGVSGSSNEWPASASLVPINSFDASLIGKRWAGDVWEVVVKPAVPTTLTDKQFRNYAAARLGGGAAVGAIWKAANDSSDTGAKFALMAWAKANTFDKSEVGTLASLLVDASCMTVQQRTALLTAWPEA